MKRFFSLGLLTALIPALAWAQMTTPVMINMGATAPSSSATKFSPVIGNDSSLFGWGNSADGPVPVAGTVDKLRVLCPGAITAGSYAVTLRKAAAATALTTTCNAANSGTVVALGSGGPISFAAGDLLGLQVTPTSPTSASEAFMKVSFTFTSSANNKSLWFWGHLASTTETPFIPLSSSGALTASQDASKSIMPTAGTISAIYVKLNTAPGGSASVTYTLWKNEAATSCLVVVATNATTHDLGVCAVAVVAGDRIALQRAPTGTGTPAAAFALGSIEFDPTTNGESVQVVALAPNSTSTKFAPASGNGTQTTETNDQVIAPVAFVAKKLYANVVTAAGASKGWSFTLMNGGSATALTTTLTNATDNSDVSDTPTVSDQTLLDVRIAPISTPASTTFGRTGFVSFIDPSGAPPPKRPDGLMMMGVG